MAIRPIIEWISEFGKSTNFISIRFSGDGIGIGQLGPVAMISRSRHLASWHQGQLSVPPDVTHGVWSLQHMTESLIGAVAPPPQQQQQLSRDTCDSCHCIRYLTDVGCDVTNLLSGFSRLLACRRHLSSDMGVIKSPSCPQKWLNANSILQANDSDNGRTIKALLNVGLPSDGRLVGYQDHFDRLSVSHGSSSHRQASARPFVVELRST